MDSSAVPQAYRVLARSYRPTRLSELIGQEALVRTLGNALASGRVAHAFLLSGIRGVGKTTTARIIARGLNCTGPDGQGGPTAEPCGRCPSCLAMAQERPIDVIEMDAATRTGIDDIREIVDSVRYAPAASRYKVYIIDEVHMLSEKAFNGLLKTLEEPPPHAKFIFATTEARKVPVTVLSRCQRFDLRRVEPEGLAAHLAAICAREKVTVEPAALALVAAAAEGSVRDSLSLLDQAIALGGGEVGEALVQEMLGLGDRARIVELLDTVLEGDAGEALDRFGALYGLGADPAAVLQDLLGLVHTLSRLAAGAPPGESGTALGPSLLEKLRVMAGQLSLPVLARAWQILLKGLEEVRSAPGALAAGEMVLLRLACVSDLPPPGEIARLLRGGGALPSGTAPAGTRSEPPAGRATAPALQAGGQATARQMAAPVPQPARQAAPRDAVPESFEEMIALLRRSGEKPLAAFLHGGARVIRFEPGRIEFRPAPGLPPDVASRLAEAATRITGRRWIVALGQAPGEPTMAEREQAAKQARIEALAGEDAMRRVLEAFPGSAIIDVRPVSDETDHHDMQRDQQA
ncbi:DNA polymerase III subunit gamma/tau [Marinimicrococcus flavescens]|uniref:DNA polymerase III subunit gamma/tau n=1 Tax=Marinimicrococcus flavescens TaxID=3031815 RepID=A0AAP3XQU1_9PROT|nr:DNA polymerase III subunit gamma/tau [Marinimicrococcus flavescens]